MLKYRLRKLFKGFLIGIVLTILTLMALVSIFLWALAGYPGERTKNIKKYNEMIEDDRLTTGLIIFPEKIPEGAVDTEYSYRFYDVIFSPSYEIFLQCTYDEETYRMEVERLENISKRAGSRTLRLLHDEEGKYPYPVYIAVENFHHCYEYALLSGENEITYISTAYFGRDKVKFDEKYLPTDYMTDIGRSFTSGYSIYAVSITPASIDTDYSRNEVAEVLDGHTRWIDYGAFTVRTRLDEQDREIITDCLFYYNVEDDSQKAKEDIEYHDLDGYVYQYLELNEERTHAIITYLDGEEEKEFVVELPEED